MRNQAEYDPKNPNAFLMGPARFKVYAVWHYPGGKADRTLKFATTVKERAEEYLTEYKLGVHFPERAEIQTGWNEGPLARELRAKWSYGERWAIGTATANALGLKY